MIVAFAVVAVDIEAVVSRPSAAASSNTHVASFDRVSFAATFVFVSRVSRRPIRFHLSFCFVHLFVFGLTEILTRQS